MLLYHWYELGQAAFRPARAAAGSCRLFFNPFNPLTHTAVGRSAVAACEVFERATRRYDKPDFGITRTRVDGQSVKVSEEVVWQTPFCRLLHFKRDIDPALAAQHPRLLLVAPMSGHFATLLRGTVETFLPEHEVYITDWQDARDVPQMAGSFDLDDYIDTMVAMFRFFGGDVHVFAVCQPSVPVLAATALMEAEDDPAVPLTLVLAGGPVDTRINRTADRLDKSVEQINGIVAEINAGHGTLGKLIKDEQLYNDARAAIAKFNTTADRIDNMVAAAQRGEGTLGKLLTDDTLYTNVNQLSSEGVKLIYDFRQNPKKYLTIKFELF